MQASDLFAEAVSNMQVGSIRNQWEKGWLPTAVGKGTYFHAVAQHRLGLVAQAGKNFGEAVARLQVSECVLRGEA